MNCFLLSLLVLVTGQLGVSPPVVQGSTPQLFEGQLQGQIQGTVVGDHFAPVPVPPVAAQSSSKNTTRAALLEPKSNVSSGRQAYRETYYETEGRRQSLVPPIMPVVPVPAPPIPQLPLIVQGSQGIFQQSTPTVLPPFQPLPRFENQPAQSQGIQAFQGTHFAPSFPVPQLPFQQSPPQPTQVPIFALIRSPIPQQGSSSSFNQNSTQAEPLFLETFFAPAPVHPITYQILPPAVPPALVPQPSAPVAPVQPETTTQIPPDTRTSAVPPALPQQSAESSAQYFKSDYTNQTQKGPLTTPESEQLVSNASNEGNSSQSENKTRGALTESSSIAQDYSSERQALREGSLFDQLFGGGRERVQQEPKLCDDSVRKRTNAFFEKVASWSFDQNVKDCGELKSYLDENTTFFSWIPSSDYKEICTLLKRAWVPSNLTWKINFVNEALDEAYGSIFASGRMHDHRVLPDQLEFQFVIQIDPDTCKVLFLEVIPLETEAMFEMYMTPALRHLHELMRVLLTEGTNSPDFKKMFSDKAQFETPNLYHFFANSKLRVGTDQFSSSEVFRLLDFDNSTIRAISFPFASDDKAVANVQWERLKTKNGTELKDMEFWIVADLECTQPVIMFEQLQKAQSSEKKPMPVAPVVNRFVSSASAQHCDSTIENQTCQDGTPCISKYLICKDPKQCKCPRYFPNGTHYCDSTRTDSKCEDGTSCSPSILKCSDPMRCPCPLKDKCNVTEITLIVNRPLNFLQTNSNFKFGSVHTAPPSTPTALKTQTEPNQTEVHRETNNQTEAFHGLANQSEAPQNQTEERHSVQTESQANQTEFNKTKNVTAEIEPTQNQTEPIATEESHNQTKPTAAEVPMNPKPETEIQPVEPAGAAPETQSRRLLQTKNQTIYSKQVFQTNIQH